MKSPKRRLILHVGQNRAGGMATGNFLKGQRDRLHQHGSLFARTGFGRANPPDAERTPDKRLAR